MPTLIVPSGPSRALVDAHDSALPGETCGFLLGRTDGDTMKVVEVMVSRNAGSSRDAFEIPSHEVAQASAEAKAREQQILALFHSHPSGDASLSATDLASLRYSAWPWLIVTRESGTARITLTCYASRSGARIAVRAEE